jgi:GNAT superfamily N-acetyltransferase
VIVAAVDWSNPDAESLRAAQRAEIAERYGTDDSEPGPAPTAADITAFFVAYTDDGEPAGCGGLRALGDSEAEIKRMFVAPQHRGSGVSTAILARLEGFGLERGWSRLVLETGTAQPDAVRFYTREGFTPIPAFGHYPDSPASLFFEKALVPVDPAADTACEGCE